MPINVFGNSYSKNSGNKIDTGSFLQRLYLRINYIEVKETTQKFLIKESQPETPQLAIESTPNQQPIENNEGVAYDVNLENTL